MIIGICCVLSIVLGALRELFKSSSGSRHTDEETEAQRKVSCLRVPSQEAVEPGFEPRKLGPPALHYSAPLQLRVGKELLPRLAFTATSACFPFPSLILSKNTRHQPCEVCT